ncbi:hypothetical protein FVEG_04767 [Fusarium verticillioides 7600]|uniref:Uncharacterized protein n=1 Tax=Gibberella moniliformis (strain M3125 / FGSC 7600) TaxID=334819 RepID=W7M6J8_GIBM7|nr:hypothetical protein FVEG_04767 [Fusarium verticillioides 7600]EWG43190.1 hypothetical protein FVEG_04767 [Fusarium verticillioides 7600]RBQ94460.1 hypothetical protein FVER53263_04767 [Fusarium verticillioides]
MASQERDRLILREDFISDDKVPSSRDPNTVLRNHSKLTREDKLALIEHAQEYACVLVHQRGQASANSKKLLKRFHAEIFLHWSTAQKRNRYPSHIPRLSTGVPVGSLKKTFSNDAAKDATRKCDEPAYLRLFVNENAKSIEWTWHNGQGLAFTPEPIEFEPGLTVTQAKINAIHNYDDHERQRISSYNIQRITCATRRIPVKWAAGGSKIPPKVEPEDMDSNPATCSCIDLACSMATEYSQIVKDINGESGVRTGDPDSN